MNERPFWLRRWFCCLVLLAIAAAHYGSYYRHGINFVDEGGTLTLQTQRLLAGETPIRQVELGYNTGWFAPLVLLFKFTGTSFVALRVFFFAVSTATALLGFLTVEKAARFAGIRRGAVWLGLATALVLIATPGMTFKNYNPFFIVANAWCILGFILGARNWAWALGGGLVLGATWTARIDLGTLLSLLWLGVLGAALLNQQHPFLRQLKRTALALALLVAGVVAMHVPAIWDAKSRGYYEDFTGGYTAFWRQTAGMFGVTAPTKAPPAAVRRAPSETPAAAGGAPTQPAAKPGTWTTHGVTRPSWADVSAAPEGKRFERFGLFALTYAPVGIALIMLGMGASAWLVALVKKRDTRGPLAALALMGAAFAMFPQFFLWRPDSPHLSEFGPGWWVATAGALALLGSSGNSWRLPRALAAVLFLHAALWLAVIGPDRWCGTIAARSSRKEFYEGANGVRVFEQRDTVKWMREFVAAVHANSGPDDEMVVWPYHHALNVIATRRTAERETYVDETDARPAWHAAAIRRLESRKPRLIVTSEWAPNRTEQSKFKNWAAPVFAHITAHYDAVGTFDKKEQFTLWRRKAAAENGR